MNGEYKLEDVDEMRIDSSALIKHKITMDDMSFPQSLVDDAKQQIRQTTPCWEGIQKPKH